MRWGKESPSVNCGSHAISLIPPYRQPQEASCGLALRRSTYRILTQTVLQSSGLQSNLWTLQSVWIFSIDEVTQKDRIGAISCLLSYEVTVISLTVVQSRLVQSGCQIIIFKPHWQFLASKGSLVMVLPFIVSSKQSFIILSQNLHNLIRSSSPVHFPAKQRLWRWPCLVQYIQFPPHRRRTCRWTSY